MPAPLKNRAIMVLGMHRSGTSAFTGVLSLMGVDLGARLLPASSSNPSGHWEHEEVVSVHDSLLMALGTKWDDPRALPAGWLKSEPAAAHREKLLEIIVRDFAGSPLWALKDPRLCKLLPLWISLLEELDCEPVWVLLARHPCESIRSLESREGFSREKSELLWLRYTLDAERETGHRNRLVITFDQLLEDWEATGGCIAPSIFRGQSPQTAPVPTSENFSTRADATTVRGMRANSRSGPAPHTRACSRVLSGTRGKCGFCWTGPARPSTPPTPCTGLTSRPASRKRMQKPRR
jgi:hypothetical protein